MGCIREQAKPTVIKKQEQFQFAVHLLSAPLWAIIFSSSTSSSAMSFSIRQRANSFRFAVAGLRAALSSEHNTWVHLAFTVTASVAGLLLQVSALEWIALLVVMSMVWAAELFNTALEHLADLYTTERHPQVKLIKDVAAAAVLITAIAALLVGCIIFLPKLKIIC